MSLTGKTIIIERDVQTILVPSGQVLELKAGTPVRVTQALGDNFSVEVFGQLVMIGGENRDALGLESNEAAYAFLQDSSLGVEEKAIRQIKTCYDPELPVNVYDLGLIYHIDVLESSMHIAMTLTSPTCGMGPFIVEEVKRKLHMIPGVDQVKIELVFDPPWDKTRLSQTAKLALNIF